MILKLYDENDFCLCEGNQDKINEYMTFNGIEYTFESIQKIDNGFIIYYDNGDKLVIKNM